MKKMEQLYEGKAKKVYATDDPNLVIVDYKDDATAGDGAGMAAHLAGAIAANTVLPVIGIPCKGGAMDGLDALLATVQMPSGIPVATVALNGAKNAAVLAAQILAVYDERIAGLLNGARADMEKEIAAKDEKLQAEVAAL